MLALFSYPSTFGLHLRRRAGAILLVAVLGGMAALAGTFGVLQPAPALAQTTTACTTDADGTMICPPSATTTGSSTPFSNCYPGTGGYSCTTYGPNGAQTVTNCLQGQAGFTCTSSGPGGSSSVANCLTSGASYSCSVTSPGAPAQTTSCTTSSSQYTCANSVAGALASGYTCLTDGSGNQSCSSPPASAYQQPVASSGAYQLPAASSGGGQYCTDATGGQVWVSAGSPANGLTCGAGA